MHTPRHFVAPVLVLGAATVMAAQEGPNVTFRVEVNYVEVDARVVDLRGTFVTGLGRADFQVFEDGVEQTLTNVALVDIPVERQDFPLFATAPIEPDVATNARDFDGRLYMIVLDDLHTLPSRTHQARNTARRFIETRLGANDVAAIVTVRGGSPASQGFTSHRRLLLQAVDRFVGKRLDSETAARLNTPQPDANGAIGPASTDPLDVERALDAVASLETVRNAADFLAGVRGRRKALIFISEGIGYQIADFTRAGSSRVAASAEAAIAAATRANVAIYGIDPQGLTLQGDELIELAGTTLSLGARSLQAEMQVAHDSLRVLSDATGGFAIVNTNNLSGALDRVVAENSSYYMLGYYSTNTRREGKTRRIDVRVRRQGLQVFARRDYVEPRGRPAAQPPPATVTGASPVLVEAMRSPLPLSGLTFSATSAAFRGTAADASVAIVIEAKGTDLELKEEGGAHTGRVELAIAAYDREGRFKGGQRSTLTLALQPDTLARVRENGVRMLSRLDLAPGRYQLRIGTLLAGVGTHGSVFHDVEIPDFAEGDLTMSGLLLTSLSAGRISTVTSDSQLADVLPAPPTTRREFPEGDELAFFVEVYDNRPMPVHTIDLSTHVLADDGQLVFTSAEARSSEESLGKPGGYGYGMRLPLTGLPPGPYVLKVEARSRLGSAEPLVRQVQFRVTE